MKTQHLFFRYLPNMDLTIKILFSSDNCIYSPVRTPGVYVENTSSVSPACRKRRLKGRRYVMFGYCYITAPLKSPFTTRWGYGGRILDLKGRRYIAIVADTS